MNKILIYFILIFTCIILFLLYNKTHNESFNSFDNNNIPTFIKNYQNINFNEPPNYKNQMHSYSLL